MAQAKVFSVLTLFALIWTAAALEVSLKTAIDTGVEPRRLAAEVEIVKAKIKAVAGKDQAVADALAKVVLDAQAQACDQDAADAPAVRVCVSSADKTVNVKFISPAEVSDLNLEGVPLDAEEIDLGKYVSSFVEHYKQLAVTPEDKLKVIKDAAAKFGKNTFEFNPADLDKGSAHVSFGATEPKDGFDLRWEKDTQTLSVETNYFENSLTLTMAEKALIEAEVTKVLGEVMKHMERSKRFALSESDNEAEHNTEKTLTCKDLIAESGSISTLANDLRAKVSNDNAGSPTKADVKYNGQDIKVTCDLKADGEIKLLVLTVNLGGNFEEITQPFFETSLYDLKPVAESFFEDIALLASKIYGAPALAK